MHLLRLALPLLLLAPLAACPPRLHNDDDDAAGDDDDAADDDDAVEDPCCEASGDPGVWEECENREAGECVCEIDAFCCGGGWDGSCADLYVSPCGALCGP